MEDAAYAGGVHCGTGKTGCSGTGFAIGFQNDGEALGSLVTDQKTFAESGVGRVYMTAGAHEVSGFSLQVLGMDFGL